MWPSSSLQDISFAKTEFVYEAAGSLASVVAVYVLFQRWTSATTPDATSVALYVGAGERIKLATASLSSLSSFRPALFCSSPHIQCLLFGRLKPSQRNRIERELVSAHDGGCYALDWYISQRLASSAPIMIAIPTITGSTAEMLRLCADAEKRGYRPVVFIKRGLDGVMLTTPRFAGFGETEDLHDAICRIAARYPEAQRVGVGFSAGSGLLAAYVGKHVDESLLAAAVLVSPGWDPRSLLRTGSMPHLYHQNILSKLKELVVKHEHVLKRSESQIDIQAALAASCLSEFDEHVFMAGNGYSSLDEYWADNDAALHFNNSQCLTLAINALDDPVCLEEFIPFGDIAKMENCALLTTPRGGHCAWFEQLWPEIHTWVHEPIFLFLAAACQQTR